MRKRLRVPKSGFFRCWLASAASSVGGHVVIAIPDHVRAGPPLGDGVTLVTPSTTWLLRHLAIRLEQSAGGIEIDMEDTARSLGLGERLGPNAPFARTLKRCVDFDMAEWRGPGLLAVRRVLPPLARRHLRRLPESLQARHEAAEHERLPMPPVDSLRRHGYQLALSLVDLGEDQHTTEQQLRRLRFHPALATECAAWAVEEQARRAVARLPTSS